MSTSASFLVVGVVFVVVGGWFAVHGVQTARRLRDFARRAVPASAQVIDLRESWLRHEDGPDVRVFRPVVRFRLPDDRTVETATMSARTPPPAQVGQVIEVRYDPSDPTRADLVHGAVGGTMSWLMTGLGLVFVVIGVGSVGVWYVVTQVLR